MRLKCVPLGRSGRCKQHGQSPPNGFPTITNSWAERTQRYASLKLTQLNRQGSRVGSSNYPVTPNWACGAQLVALNWQFSDESMWLNTGRFMDNGSSGFVLKPPIMRTTTSDFPSAFLEDCSIAYYCLEVSGNPNSPYKKIAIQIKAARNLPSAVKPGLIGSSNVNSYWLIQ